MHVYRYIHTCVNVHTHSHNRKHRHCLSSANICIMCARRKLAMHNVCKAKTCTTTEARESQLWLYVCMFACISMCVCACVRAIACVYVCVSANGLFGYRCAH